MTLKKSEPRPLAGGPMSLKKSAQEWPHDPEKNIS